MPRSPLFLLATAALLGGAAAPLRADDDADARRLYRAKCSGCHRLYKKEERTPEQWREKLPEMAKRAKLTPEQLAILAKYLGAAEEPAQTPTPAPTPVPSHGDEPSTK